MMYLELPHVLATEVAVPNVVRKASGVLEDVVLALGLNGRELVFVVLEVSLDSVDAAAQTVSVELRHALVTNENGGDDLRGLIARD
jgi:hypothetical protein